MSDKRRTLCGFCLCDSFGSRSPVYREAKVNGQMAPLKYELKTGDIVEGHNDKKDIIRAGTGLNLSKL